MFKTYPSNVPLGTGHNYILSFGETRRLTARCYLRAESYAVQNWAFWFSNRVDSTFDHGDIAYRGLSGGNWKILSARIGDGGKYVCENMAEPAPVTDWTQITFDGKTERDVLPSEMFWSDPVSFLLPEDHLLVWEWVIEGDGIPCTPDSQAPTFVGYGDNPLTYQPNCPMPDLFGAKRDVKNRIVFWGDSITQGCGTRNNFYEMWVARIAAGLGPDYSIWNIGLGWGMASCAVNSPSWQFKASQADTVCMAFGVNDTNHNCYENWSTGNPDTIRKNIISLVHILQEKGIRVILFTIPPFDYPGENYQVWRTLRESYPQLAKELGVTLFDFSSALDGNPPYGNSCIYGSHPDGNGGLSAAQAFLQQKYFD